MMLTLKIMKGFRMQRLDRGWFARLVLAFTLFCVSMDAVIDALEIWYGKDIAVSFDLPVLRSFPMRANVRIHEGLYAGSYFEAQSEPQSDFKLVPGVAFNLILSSTSTLISESKTDFKTALLLLHTLISLPPPLDFLS